MKKIKLLHIQILPILSGVQRVSINIMANLDPMCYERWMICSPDSSNRSNSMITELEQMGVKVKVLNSLRREPSLYDFKALWEIYKFCRKEKFDVIHAHTSKGGFLGRISGSLTGCKKILYTVHNLPFHKYQNFIKRFIYFMLEFFAGFFGHKVIFVNKAYIKDYWFLPKNKVLTIYNGIDFSYFKAKELRRDNKIRLISVGRLDFQKDPLTLLEALKISIEKDKNIEALIIGDGEYFEKVNSFIKLNNLEKNIKLLGWCDNKKIANYLAESDIFCSSPICEAFGLVFCEAGYTGLPCISTNIGGVSEVIINGKTGILVEPSNPTLLSNAILELSQNKEKISEMGKNAKKIIVDRFSIEQMVRLYRMLYEA